MGRVWLDMAAWAQTNIRCQKVKIVTPLRNANTLTTSHLASDFYDYLGTTTSLHSSTKHEPSVWGLRLGSVTRRPTHSSTGHATSPDTAHAFTCGTTTHHAPAAAQQCSSAIGAGKALPMQCQLTAGWRLIVGRAALSVASRERRERERERERENERE